MKLIEKRYAKYTKFNIIHYVHDVYDILILEIDKIKSESFTRIIFGI